MTEISNYYSPQQVGLQPHATPNPQKRQGQISLPKYAYQAKRKDNGLIEKIYNWTKNLTGLGVGSKKVDAQVKRAMNGEISSKEAMKTIHDYNSSQETSAQLFGDIASVGAGAFAFLVLRKQAKMFNAQINLNKNAKSFADFLPVGKKYAEKIVSICKSNKKMMATVTGASALVAGLTKYWTLKFNRVGSDEFKVDEKVYGKKSQRNSYQKFLAKDEKKRLKKERRITNFKNFLSGTINGLMLPVLALGGAIGAPLYLIGNNLNRYFVASKTDKNKSIGSYFDNLKNDIVTTGVITAGAAIPFVKKGNYVKVFDQNLKKATDKLMDKTLKTPDYASKSAFEELQSLMFVDKKVSAIMQDFSVPIEEQITKLTKENIFAVKFKQISADSSTLTEALREKCPPTRTLEQAETYISEALGSGYSVKKLLGVGTIAETYLAKAPDGKEVCVKVLKEGINEKKILEDKEKLVKLVKEMAGKNEEEKKFLLKNVDDLAEGILKEVNFANEMEAAKKLAPHTKVANVVMPIEVKNSVYVMEKANGISLSSLVELNVAKLYKKSLEKGSSMDFSPTYRSELGQALKNVESKNEKLKIVNDYIKKIESRTPEFGDISLDRKDINNLLDEYTKVLVEQFSKVDKNGKVIHADIHPGNIFIDVNALKKKNNNKIFTLIDTGNTVNQSMEQAMRAINLSSYVERGNVVDITEYVLEGAVLPKGLSKKDATEKISAELKKAFFDNETKLGTVTNQNILNLTSNIMRKYGIIPNDTQLNLNKAIKSANNSLKNLAEATAMINCINAKDFFSTINAVKNVIQDIAVAEIKYNFMKKAQEKANLKLLPLAEQIKHKNNPNNLATNSEDYLVYKLKQKIMGDNVPKINKNFIE